VRTAGPPLNAVSARGIALTIAFIAGGIIPKSFLCNGFNQAPWPETGQFTAEAESAS